MAPEIERLLGEPRLGMEDNDGMSRLKGRAQRIVENGETLRYIQLVLRQLRRASRDHRQLVEERHRATQPLCKSSTTRTVPSNETWMIPGRRSVRDHGRIPWERPPPVLRGKREESSELVEFASFDIAARLLTKRKTYGTGFNVLERTPRKIDERPSTSTGTGRQRFRHVPGYAGIDTAIIQ